MSHRTHGFTLLELAIAVIIVVIAVILLLPVLGGSRQGPQMKSNMHVRAIQQSLVIFSQGNGQWYPGFDKHGTILDATVEGRYQIILNAAYFGGEYMISPRENKVTWTTGPVTSANYSFAMLDIDAGGGRAAEWRQTLNQHAVVLSDRNIGSDAHGNVDSLHQQKPGSWQGSVGWNDNHVRFESSHELANTQYGAATPNPLDNLFEDAGGDDAYMIYTGD